MTQAEANKALKLNKAVQNKINAEIKNVERQIENAKKRNVDVPEWVTYLACLRTRLIDASKTCTKPTATIAQAIAKARQAPKKAKEDVAKIRGADIAATDKIKGMTAKAKAAMKNTVIRLAKSKVAKQRARATELATKYCLLLNPDGSVRGEVCTPTTVQAKAAQAASKGKSRRKGMRGMGEDGIEGEGTSLDPFGPEIGGGGDTIGTTTVGDTGINNTGDLGITQVDTGDMDCSILLMALGGEAAVDPKCAKRPNKPVCMMARMQEEQKQQFAILVLFLCEMINDLKTSITNVPIYDSTNDPNNVPIYDPYTDPYMDTGGGMVLGPTEDAGFIDSGVAEEGGGMEMTTGPMPDQMVDEAVAFDSGGDGGFDNSWATQQDFNDAIPTVSRPTSLPVQDDFTESADEFGISDEGFTDEGFGEDFAIGDDVLDFSGGEGGLFGLSCNGDALCTKCTKNNNL